MPFCSSVCPYCDFAVLIAGDERRARWADSVVREAGMYAHGGLVFDTVYLGGGTPSCVSPERLGEVLDGLRGHLGIVAGAQVFLEANPEDVSRSAVDAWKSLGVHTVSLGVQSFDEATLAYLGRRHTADEARAAADTLLAADFHTVSVDLIYSFDGQSPASWRSQIEEATALGVQHFSCYQLTIHHRTVFGRRLERGLVRELPAEAQAELFFMTHEVLADAGFEGYEASSFAVAPEHRSYHNRKYWNHTPYLGLGPSAHSFAGGRRWWNRPKLRLWRSALDAGRSPVEGEEWPNEEQLLLEAVMLGLRTTDGLDLGALQQRFGFDLLQANAGLIDRLCASGHLEIGGGFLWPTLSGIAVADALAASFDLDPGGEGVRKLGS
ncbi:MAG: coproporphyrinogen-III oxidase family protein [Thermoanaerobaculales bacterium]